MQTTTSSSVATTAVEAPSSSSAAATPVPVKCSWTEHTSPDGFKYYYSSVTGESRVSEFPITPKCLYTFCVKFVTSVLVYHVVD